MGDSVSTPSLSPLASVLTTSRLPDPPTNTPMMMAIIDVKKAPSAALFRPNQALSTPRRRTDTLYTSTMDVLGYARACLPYAAQQLTPRSTGPQDYYNPSSEVSRTYHPAHLHRCRTH